MPYEREVARGGVMAGLPTGGAARDLHGLTFTPAPPLKRLRPYPGVGALQLRPRVVRVDRREGIVVRDGELDRDNGRIPSPANLDSVDGDKSTTRTVGLNPNRLMLLL